MCRFSDACTTTLSTRADGRRTKSANGRNRERWGDYGAATVSGSSLWIANEWIGQRCTFDQWLGGDLTCNGTRTPFENWFTRLTRLNPTS